jgi:hypothetical protein
MLRKYDSIVLQGFFHAILQISIGVAEEQGQLLNVSQHHINAELDIWK